MEGAEAAAEGAAEAPDAPAPDGCPPPMGSQAEAAEAPTAAGVPVTAEVRGAVLDKPGALVVPGMEGAGVDVAAPWWQQQARATKSASCGAAVKPTRPKTTRYSLHDPAAMPATMQKASAQEVMDFPRILKVFHRWLSQGPYAKSSVATYYGVVHKLFYDHLLNIASYNSEEYHNFVRGSEENFRNHLLATSVGKFQAWVRYRDEGGQALESTPEPEVATSKKGGVLALFTRMPRPHPLKDSLPRLPRVTLRR